MAIVALASGLCFVCATLVMMTTSSGSPGFLAPAALQQVQQMVQVHDVSADVVSADVVSLEVVIRDFKKGHPDFETDPWATHGYDSNKPTLGLVQDKLGGDGNPVYRGGMTVSSKTTFDQWYNDVPGVNVREVLKLNMHARCRPA